mgnify:FL=1
MANDELVPTRSSSDIILRPKYPVNRQAQREIHIFRDTQLAYRNFTGKPGPYNEEGVRSFSVMLDEELAKDLMDQGLNIKPMKNYDDDGADQLYHLPVAVSYRIRPPRIYMVTGDGQRMPLRKTLMPEDSLEMMDNLEFSAVHLVVAISNYTVRGSSGKKAYLQSLFGHVAMDPLEEEYATVEDMMYVDAAEHAHLDVIEGEFEVVS